MAPPVQRQPRRTPIIPVVPRIFETKKSAVKASAVETKAEINGVSSEHPAPKEDESVLAAASFAPESNDWASLAAEEHEEGFSTVQNGYNTDSATADTPKASDRVNGEPNGHLDVHTQPSSEPLYPVSVQEEPEQGRDHRQPAMDDYHQAPSPLVPQMNGYQPVMPHHMANGARYPPGLAPFHRRGAPHIAFGSFHEVHDSESSSPTLPPSTTSAHFTQPTPISDTQSQGSRGGHGIIRMEPAIGGPPVPHNQAHQSKSLRHRPGSSDFLVHAVAEFNDRNRDGLLRLVQQDMFAEGATELDLTVSAQDGKATFKFWRAICRRSPELSRLLDQTTSGSAYAELQSSSPFVSLDSVRSVIQSLFGSPLVSGDVVEGRSVMPYKRPLEIIATSYLLGAGLALDFGTQLVLKMISWESLAVNFQFCLEGFQVDYGKGKSVDLVDISHIVQLPRPHAIEILAQSLNCIIREINDDESFKFDDHANLSEELSGGFHARPVSVSLPGSNHNTSQTNGPALIQFGNMGNTYRHKHQTLSSILLSLPLLVLQHVLAHMFNLQTVREVVQERERRRLFAVKRGTMAYHARYQESLVPVAEYNGLRVVSKRVS